LSTQKSTIIGLQGQALKVPLKVPRRFWKVGDDEAGFGEGAGLAYPNYA